jgi:putative tryptophan/tyrosine transport system substrate-binding protein
MMRRREFVTLLGGAAVSWPLVARAQQPAMPVIGFLYPGSPDANASRLGGFRQGLKDAGFAEGENLAVEYRWAYNQMHRLPELAADLVHRHVAVIAVTGVTATSAVKAASATIPVVFSTGADPVKLGLVASLNRPGGNVTGISFSSSELVAKRLELLRELVPTATRVAVLVSPANAAITETTLRDVQSAARAVGLQIRVLNADTSREIDAAFGSFERERPEALFVGPGPFFADRRVHLALFASRYTVPATYSTREFVEAGGLMSYGASLTDAYRQVGVYAARILKGTKPADLPVLQPTKFEFVINLLAARALGLEVPPTLLARADEVIE